MATKGDVDEVAALLTKCAGSLLRIEGRDRMLEGLRETGLTLNQIAAVQIVFVERSISVSALAKALGLAVTSTSNLVQRLVEAGFVLRWERPDDRRERTLTLTAAGHRLVDRLAAARTAAGRGLAERIDGQLRRELVSVLTRLSDTLDRPHGKATT